MKIRVADYIAQFLADYGITQVFSVVGGGAMHLNNAFALEKRLHKTYNHHEQACAIAAESYSRINNKIAAVCVTSGPGGTNALTGVLCAWQDSLPVIVISGQVRYDITVESTGLDLRQFGEQEYYIVRSAAPMTKYAVMIRDAATIKYHLAKALDLATSGRRGPVWIDVPLNIQGQIIETDDLLEYIPPKRPKIQSSQIDEIISEIDRAKRPVFIAGSGLRTSGALERFARLAREREIPVVCPTSTADYFTMDDPFYCGMFGVFGGRMGNFVVQNADLLVSFGARLSFKQIGFNYEGFSPNSRKVIVDADQEELKKPTIHADVPVCADVADVIDALLCRAFAEKTEERRQWLAYCGFLKEKYGMRQESTVPHITAQRFCSELLCAADEHAVVVLGNNTAAVSMLQHGIVKHGQRMYGNVNCGTMGYDLPASIGAAEALGGEVICATGEGSFQMNLQELQTIAHNALAVKIVVFNNNKYQAIVQTHRNFFNGVMAGCTNDSGISFPSFEKLCSVYGFPFMRIDSAEEIPSAVEWLLAQKGRALLELVQTEEDQIIPKLSSKRLDNGEMVSPPIDDLAPFLSKEEYEMCQFQNFLKREAF
ncbi:MAG: thiamine pyrophosphate-binding protein [Ruminococcaceae bacterium]|nr:thiamine pyrophosphate-binding protein [Oscillospiraceae bacterium]